MPHAFRKPYQYYGCTMILFNTWYCTRCYHEMHRLCDKLWGKRARYDVALCGLPPMSPSGIAQSWPDHNKNELDSFGPMENGQLLLHSLPATLLVCMLIVCMRAFFSCYYCCRWAISWNHALKHSGRVKFEICGWSKGQSSSIVVRLLPCW